VLGVTGTAADPGAVCRAVAGLRERSGGALLYAVGVARPVWEYSPPLQVASAPCRLEFPWSRGEAGAPEHAEAFGAELAAALAAAPQDTTAPAQAAWYGAPEGHARLHFDPATLAPRPGLLQDRRLLDCIA
jgi:hypothetical protein